MHIWISDVTIPEGRRKVDDEAVKQLAQSIEQIGLVHPITVVRKGGTGITIKSRERVRGKYVLVAGLHRLEAFKKLGKDRIPAVIMSLTYRKRRLWEIAENLHRAELTVQERSDLIAEWVELVKQNKAAQLAPPGGKQQREEGIRAASRELGLKRREVQRAVKIAGITPEAKRIAFDIGFDDNQSKLLQIAIEKTPKLQVAKAQELAQPPEVESAHRPLIVTRMLQDADDALALLNHVVRALPDISKIARAFNEDQRTRVWQALVYLGEVANETANTMMPSTTVQ